MHVCMIKPHSCAVSKQRSPFCDECFCCPQLTMEVITQLSRMFQPDPRMIKKQIESLIDREYLERDTVGSLLFAFRFRALYLWRLGVLVILGRARPCSSCSSWLP